MDYPDFVINKDFEEQKSRKEENTSDYNLHIDEEISKQRNYPDRSLNQIGTSTSIDLVIQQHALRVLRIYYLCLVTYQQDWSQMRNKENMDSFFVELRYK